MNNKFFGNSLDLFKFDILTSIALSESMTLFYIPMLTEPKEKKNDPKYLAYHVGTNNKSLYSFLKNCYSIEKLDFDQIITYLESINCDFKIIIDKKKTNQNAIKLNGIGLFSNDLREQYFLESCEKIKQVDSKSLIFIDPCVGLDAGITRRVRSNRVSYLNAKELKLILASTKENDVVCYFQHLGNHHYDLLDRIKDLKKEFGENLLLVGDKRIQGSLVFIFKSIKQFENYKKILFDYLNQYRNKKNNDKLILM